MFRSIEWKDDDDRSEEEKEKKGGRFNEKKNITIYRNHTDNQMIQYKKFVRILEIKQTQKCWERTSDVTAKKIHKWSYE